MSYTDIEINKNRDIALDSASIPIRVKNEQVIVQDIKHMLLETGLIYELIGERSLSQKLAKLDNILSEIEKDERIVAGSVEIEQIQELIYISFQTIEGEFFEVIEPLPNNTVFL